MLIAQGTDPNGLPYVEQDVNGVIERRYLTALPTPPGHKMLALPSWSQATGITPIPRSEWPNMKFKRVHTAVPILDQDGEGACVGFAATSAAMVLRDRAGETFVMLSASFLYSLICGGVDRGANGGDAADTMQGVGIATAKTAPGLFYRPAGYNAAAKAEAARFKLASVAPVTSIDEAVTAVQYGWELLFDVEASGRYATDANGVVAYCGRATNHEQHASEGFDVLPDGQAAFLGRNSWNTVWGGGTDHWGPVPGGMGWYTQRHIENSQTTLALRYMSGDPNDANPPPVLA